MYRLMNSLRAAAASSKPRLSTRVPSRSLYTWKKCSISREVVRRDVTEVVETRRNRDRRSARRGPSRRPRRGRPGGRGRSGATSTRQPVKTGIGHQDEHVERIAVVAQGAGEEAVVAGVVHGAVEHAVEAEDAELLVELVLVALVGRDLDDGGDDLRRVRAGRDVVPGMEAAWGDRRSTAGAVGARDCGSLSANVGEIGRCVPAVACARVLRRFWARPSGGMADAADSKSAGGNPVRVRLSPRALSS